MNFKQFGSLLPDNPLCAIGTYKDELNLATGDCTRRIKKLVLDGTENWILRAEFTSATAYSLFHSDDKAVPYSSASLVCSHFEFLASYASETNHIYQDATNFYVTSTDYLTLSDFTTFLQQQYSAGTPVCVWYVLETPTTETITVPSGLSGTEEGFLNQSGTPTPTNPIYPTANTVEKWFDINHYIMGTSTDTITTLPAVIYANDTTATVGLKGDMVQSSTPSPTTPIQPSECGDLETTGEHAGQYKIPILSGNTTTPVYLGEVQSTRQIKKLVLTGEESSWTAGTTSLFILDLPDVRNGAGITSCICSHYNAIPNIETGYSTMPDKSISIRYNQLKLWIRDIEVGGFENFKAYLAQQYAAGTPVTVWYVQSTPTTGIVNEPLRKIGTYADEVSDITIPTIAGANTLSVDTTLQPSEVTVNYKGWHPVQSVHERENGAWT